MGVAQEMQAARWHEVLGEKTGLVDPWAKGLYEGLRFDPSWTAEEICDHFRKLTKKYFGFPASLFEKAWKRSSSQAL